eukprot:COSAG03_NODE_12817_length_529_cov_2.165116_1_plen_83_part_01
MEGVPRVEELRFGVEDADVLRELGEKPVYAERDFPYVALCTILCRLVAASTDHCAACLDAERSLLEIRRLCTGVAYGKDRLAL